MSKARNDLVLAIVKEDRTFEQRFGCWTGKCIHCNSAITVALTGGLMSATIEHIVPQGHGGSNELENLSLACRSCNHTKGRKIDILKEGNPKYHEVIEKLLRKKEQRKRI